VGLIDVDGNFELSYVSQKDAHFVQRVAGVGDQFAQKDVFIRVKPFFDNGENVFRVDR
jgi:hypothetical protein